MRTVCRLWCFAAAAAVISCGGDRAKSAVADSAPDTIAPAEMARRLSDAHSLLVADYDNLCRARREALAEMDEERRRERVAATDSLAEVLAERGRALDAEWWSCAAEYYDRGDGSFSEFCSAAAIDSACVDVDIRLIYESLNH
ncbi:MAG: hypothetical protein K2J31_06510 [Alistipes sp.]|nr:hypothetical protein [Alistipes sp.]MDE6862371.1 hypothetical protein [Alistipes sp.]MDE7128799.1 hypothetical protein [Alistipes sp.]